MGNFSLNFDSFFPSALTPKQVNLAGAHEKSSEVNGIESRTSQS